MCKNSKLFDDAMSFTPQELDRLSKGLPPWESMSFACGGWLQFYLFGVAKALQAKGLDEGVTYCGCSAGALAAAGLAFHGSFDFGVQFCKDKCLPKARSGVSGLLCLQEYVGACAEACLAPGYSKDRSKHLQLATTSLPYLNAVRITEFDSGVDVKRALLASCAAFPAAKVAWYRGSWCVDGGLSDFQPIIDEDTITVSPFYFSNCDIKPSRYVPLWWAFIPPNSDETVDWLYRLGWEDCLAYLKQRGIPDMVPQDVLNPEEPGSDEDEQIHVMTKAKKRRIQSTKVRWSHPYNIPKQVSVQRLLGYDLRNISNEYAFFIADLFLLFLLIAVWKPLVLLLIYVELWMRIWALSIFATIRCVVRIIFPYTSTRKLIGVPLSLFIPNNVLLMLLSNERAPSKANKHYSIRNYHSIEEKLKDCWSCVFSLSLFLRFVSGRPSRMELRKHDRLLKLSILYRFFRHII